MKNNQSQKGLLFTEETIFGRGSPGRSGVDIDFNGIPEVDRRGSFEYKKPPRRPKRVSGAIGAGSDPSLHPPVTMEFWRGL